MLWYGAARRLYLVLTKKVDYLSKLDICTVVRIGLGTRVYKVAAVAGNVTY